jgi:hypothetical protein
LARGANIVAAAGNLRLITGVRCTRSLKEFGWTADRWSAQGHNKDLITSASAAPRVTKDRYDAFPLFAAMQNKIDNPREGVARVCSRVLIFHSRDAQAA